MTADSPNPYSAPPAELLSLQARNQAPSSTTVAVDFGPILLRWESLRIVFNVLLAVFVFIVAFAVAPIVLGDLGFWISAALCGFIANVCFLLAPALEGYARYLGLWHHLMTGLIFLTGLLFTALMASAFVFWYATT